MKLLSILAFCCCTLSLFAQETRPAPAPNKPSVKSVFDIGAQVGFNNVSYFDISKDDWNRLTPGYANLDDTSYNEYSSGGYGIGAPIIELTLNKSLNIKAFINRKMTPMIMWTAGTGNRFDADLVWSKDTRFRYDTLTSTQTGTQYFIDSVSNYSYRKSINANSAATSLSFVIQTNREKRFSYLFGLGLFGSNANSYAMVETRTEKTIMNSEDSSYFYYSPSIAYPITSYSESSRNSFAGPAIWQWGFKIPLGVDFVIGTEKHPFWNRCVISVLGSVNYRKTIISDYRSFGNFGYSFSGGLKYRIDG